MTRVGLACTAVAALGAAGPACGDNLPAGHETPYFDWDGQRDVGSISIDTLSGSDDGPTLDDFDLARHDGDVMMLYAHVPGTTVAMAELETMLARAHDLGMPFFTYADLAAGTAHTTGLCLSFDDDAIDAWYTLRPLLAQYDARVSFFVTRYAEFSDEGRAELHQLYADGNGVEAHGVHHVNGPDYVAANGLAAYIADEVQPSVDILRADGFAPVAFAHPYGRHTEAIDEALWPVVTIARGISTTPGRHGVTEAPSGGSGSGAPTPALAE